MIPYLLPVEDFQSSKFRFYHRFLPFLFSSIMTPLFSSLHLLFDTNTMSGEISPFRFSFSTLVAKKREVQNAGAGHAEDGHYYYLRRLDQEQSFLLGFLISLMA